MRLNYTNERPSTLLAASCAPSVPWSPIAPVAKSALPVESAPVAILAAERAPASQAHQVQIQAELVRVLVSVDGSYGTTGFVGSNGMKRRLTDGADGVPPRGRPV
ncbi:hypothetical protein [Pseudosporangium ferrugineum]|uniref:Uncharacterized protein n=1 Tax=Pseudosporangium ferrugineum TaxID=439699 RepID=A0A2T0SDQ9_9ACTN|nr:hypothetical protein [Pseudosporangium ferrugineum]PRY31554.1 hypothetical protein CLV70_103443 [Pseudosporangium ferrugineum]